MSGPVTRLCCATSEHLHLKQVDEEVSRQTIELQLVEQVDENIAALLPAALLTATQRTHVGHIYHQTSHVTT